MCCDILNTASVSGGEIANLKAGYFSHFSGMCCSLYWKLPINRFYIKGPDK